MKNFKFRKINHLTDKKYVFVDLDNNQIENIVEVPITNCIHYFHRFKYKCENKIKFVRREDGVAEAYFTRETIYRNLLEQSREQKEFDAEIQENEQGVFALKV